MFCVVLPSVSHLDGSRALVWSMYSRAGTYRVLFTARDEEGTTREIAPTRVAEACAPGTSTTIAEDFRGGGSVLALRADLVDLALVARVQDQRALAMNVTLEERSTDGTTRTIAELPAHDPESVLTTMRVDSGGSYF